ncbi:MAG: tRNA (adenosine(37)-N6)-dimethylallyltransferase MiaA [Bryobacteraceae bacterium]|nr:tRNA (adenosine(37)-N6)-dimethylallyltransferase MiaA [Bryobacteraceae bacterium]
MFPLIGVVGPTGAGKSDLALAIALRFDGEIINCDSLQVYRYFDIGTAKLPEAGRQGIPHHLIDIVEPNELFTAGDYARLARAAALDIASRGKLPVVVGGTGFYLRAMLDGLFEGPARDEQLRVKLNDRESRRAGLLHRFLRRVDPAAAARIHGNDRNKLVRAIEVYATARRPLSDLHRGGTRPIEGFHIHLLGLSPARAELYRLLDERCRRMFELGLLEEVRGILNRGYPASSKPFESIGYKQALLLLQGSYTPQQALEEMQKQTRHYAKRQWTWFKRDARVQWLEGFGNDPAVQRQAVETIVNFF